MYYTLLQINPRAYAMPNNPRRCPVTSYKRYAELRPDDFCADNDPFYIAIKSKNPARDSDWYKKQPVGKNTIATFCHRMVKAAGIDDDRKLTNTSYRKHMASRLNESHVPKEVGRHVTGHKQASSLDNYAPLSHKQQHILSDIVGGENIDFTRPHTDGSLEYQKESDPLEENAPPTVPQVLLVEFPVANRLTQGPVTATITRADMPEAQAIATVGSVMDRFPPSSCTSVNASVRTGAQGVLYGSSIYGGSFNINVHEHHHYPAKRQRMNAIDTDSE